MGDWECPNYFSGRLPNRAVQTADSLAPSDFDSSSTLVLQCYRIIGKPNSSRNGQSEMNPTQYPGFGSSNWNQFNADGVQAMPQAGYQHAPDITAGTPSRVRLENIGNGSSRSNQNQAIQYHLSSMHHTMNSQRGPAPNGSTNPFPANQGQQRLPAGFHGQSLRPSGVQQMYGQQILHPSDMQNAYPQNLWIQQGQGPQGPAADPVQILAQQQQQRMQRQNVAAVAHAQNSRMNAGNGPYGVSGPSNQPDFEYGSGYGMQLIQNPAFMQNASVSPAVQNVRMNSPGPIRVASVSAEVLPSAHLPAAASAPVSVQPASQLPPHCGYDFECLFCQESLPTASPLVISETEFRQHTRQSAYCYKKNLDHINEMMRQGNMEGDNPVANGQVKQQLVCRLCKDGGQINRYKLADLELVAHHMQRYHTAAAATQASPASTPPSNPASVFVNQQRRSSGDLVTVGECMQGVIEHQVPGAHVPRTSSPRVYNLAQTQAGYNMMPQSTHAQQIARAQHVLAQQPLQQRRSGPQPNSSMPAGRPVLGERRSQDSPVTQHYVQEPPVQNREIVMGMGNSPVEGRSGTPGGRNTASVSGIAALIAQRGVGHGEVASVPEQDPEVIAAQPPVAFPAASPAIGPAQAAEQAPVDAAPRVVEQALVPNCSVQVVADVRPPPAYHAAVAAAHMEGVRVTNRASGASVLAPDSSTSPDGEPAQNITSTKTGSHLSKRKTRAPLKRTERAGSVEIIESVRAGGDDLADLSCDSDGNPVVSEDEPMPEPVKPCEVKMEPQPAAQHHDEFFFPDISRSAHAVLGEALSVETSIPAVTEQRCSSIDSTKENAMVDGLSVVTTTGRLPLRETAKNAVRQKIITRRWICKCGDSMESRDEFKRHYAKHQKVLPRSRSGVRYLCPRELCNYLAEDADDFATHVARHILLQHYYRMEKIKREAAEQLPSSKKK